MYETVEKKADFLNSLTGKRALKRGHSLGNLSFIK